MHLTSDKFARAMEIAGYMSQKHKRSKCYAVRGVYFSRECAKHLRVYD